MTSEVDIPETIPVKIGKNVFHMESESLIASLVHQTIHKNNLLYNSDDFAMIFDVTKIEITNFLRKKINSDFEVFDFFDGWMTEFDEFQSKKNRIFCKDFIITFPDKIQFENNRLTNKTECIKLVERLLKIGYKIEYLPKDILATYKK
jgi:hypothetical protein